MGRIDRDVFNESTPAADPVGGRRSVFAIAQLRLVGHDGFEVRVRNFSAGGLMVELPHAIAPDSAVEVELPQVGWVPGRVVWQTEGRAGIAFDHAIDPDLIQDDGGAGR
ncbi:PilZ domain-containing protein [Sphingomonas adhaesiva]|uniref:PilZ domain-containing protein n=1 Tax=Sphingomonas adhaesiva TaxID=28212 RepID=UPI002FF6BBA2